MKPLARRVLSALIIAACALLVVCNAFRPLQHSRPSWTTLCGDLSKDLPLGWAIVIRVGDGHALVELQNAERQLDVVMTPEATVERQLRRAVYYAKEMDL